MAVNVKMMVAVDDEIADRWNVPFSPWRMGLTGPFGLGRKGPFEFQSGLEWCGARHQQRRRWWKRRGRWRRMTPMRERGRERDRRHRMQERETNATRLLEWGEAGWRSEGDQ